MIPVNTPRIYDSEMRYLEEAMRTGWVSSEGAFVRLFEERFAARVGRQYGVAVSSGTAALDLAFTAAFDPPLAKGDEVILPTFTIISCLAPILRAGATPVFVDADPHTWNADTTQIEAKISPRTRAILAVHIYGLPANIEAMHALATRYGLVLIEDAAEAAGLAVGVKPCGSFGDVSTFSFYANKHLSTGEGGMIVTDDERLAERCRYYRNLCFEPNGARFVHRELGFNYRFTNIQAALGLGQLEHLDETIRIKQHHAQRYDALLAPLDAHLQRPAAAADYAPHNPNHYWVYGIVLRQGVEPLLDAAAFAQLLSKAGIGTRPFFAPLHTQPVLERYGIAPAFGAFPVAERIAKQGLYLPSGAGMPSAAVDEVARVIRACLEHGLSS